MQPFDYTLPKDYAEASALLAGGYSPGAASSSVRPLQGGTDFLIRARAGAVKPARVVDLKRLPGMQTIQQSADGWLVIGAACTMNQIAGHPEVQARYHLLAQACSSVASYQLRNRATVGGNCCNASPAADTAPALYCLEAVAETYGQAGVRRIPIRDFFTGPGRTALQPGEFLTSLHLPPAPPGGRGAFKKLGRTKIGDISIVSVAVSMHPGTAQAWRIGLGAVGPTPLRAPEAEAALAQDTSPGGVQRAAQLAAAAARPIDDIRASAAYRRAMVEVLARRGILEVLGQAGLPDRGGAG